MFHPFIQPPSGNLMQLWWEFYLASCIAAKSPSAPRTGIFICAHGEVHGVFGELFGLANGVIDHFDTADISISPMKGLLKV